MTGPSQEQRDAYAAQLVREMKRAKRTGPSLAAETGISASSIWSYRIGKTFPSPNFSAMLADALASPRLRELGTWRRECDRCRRRYEATSRGGRQPRYCSDKCRSRAMNDKKRKHPRVRRAKERVYRTNKRISERLGRLEAAVDKKCGECSAEWGLPGICPLLDPCAIIPYTILPKQQSPRAFKKARRVA